MEARWALGRAEGACGWVVLVRCRVVEASWVGLGHGMGCDSDTDSGIGDGNDPDLN